MKKLRIMECFGGIGACSKALERLGIDYEIVDYVEIDKYAVNSFNAIHNTNFEPQDIKEWDKDVKVDLVMHGSPCQDFSLSGKQAGGDKGSGTRSSLMYETVRIVEKLKPKYVVWENVKNLLSKKHRHNFDTYLDTMENLGYKNYYQVLNAKDYGIPQNRERVFTVSILGDEKYDFPKGDECNNKIDVVGNYMPSGHDASRIVNENGLAPTVKENHGTVTAVAINFEFPPKQELKLKLKDMLEDEVDEKYYLSDKVSKKVQNKFDGIENVVLGGMQEHQSIKKDGICTTLTSSMGMGGGYIPLVSKQFIQVAQMYGTHKESKPQAGRIYSVNGVSPTMDTCSGGNRMPKIMIKNNTKQGYLDAYEGDGVYTNTSTKRGTVQKDMIQTLTTFQDKGVVVKDEKNNNLRIRKLTPKEYWRLMGFDDEDFEKASKVNSNTQLYKQAGNSIVVNVLEAIFKNLLK